MTGARTFLRSCVLCVGALLTGSVAVAQEGDSRKEVASRQIIVAVQDRGEPLSGAGSSPRGDYRRMAGYAGSARSSALTDDLAREYRLQQQSAWTIAPLSLRCVLYTLAPDDDAAATLARLSQDARVQLAQPLQEFETLNGGTAGSDVAVLSEPPDGNAPRYNDTYFALQKGFRQMGTVALQQVGMGSGVKVAVIDTGVDNRHPDLRGQLAGQRDYVAGRGAQVDSVPERHGTEMVGLIAARANNRQGIVGMSPGATVRIYRACWSDANSGARCNSFTLAQGLGAAIADGADIINLSLGGPSDPLLTRLALHAQSRGALIVAAAPPRRLGKGFPSDVPGAFVVASAGDPVESSNWLIAPGRSVLTTVPDGGYDMSAGSSLAAAQVSGVLALLRAAAPSTEAARLHQALKASISSVDEGVNACRAAVSLGVTGVRC